MYFTDLERDPFRSNFRTTLDLDLTVQIGEQLGGGGE